MAKIDKADLAAVLAKMTDGEFMTIFIVKGGSVQGDDELVTYPTDGTPLKSAVVQNVLTGFLKLHPVPLDESTEKYIEEFEEEQESMDDDGKPVTITVTRAVERQRLVNRDKEGNALPKHSRLQNLAFYVRDTVIGQCIRGLERIKREEVVIDTPE